MFLACAFLTHASARPERRALSPCLISRGGRSILSPTTSWFPLQRRKLVRHDEAILHCFEAADFRNSLRCSRAELTRALAQRTRTRAAQLKWKRTGDIELHFPPPDQTGFRLPTRAISLKGAPVWSGLTVCRRQSDGHRAEASFGALGGPNPRHAYLWMHCNDGSRLGKEDIRALLSTNV